MRKIFKADYELEGYVLICAESIEDAENQINKYGRADVKLEDLEENGHLYVNLEEIKDMKDIPYDWKKSIPFGVAAGDDNVETILDPIMQAEKEKK